MPFEIRCNGFPVHSFEAKNRQLAKCEFFRYCSSRLGDSLDCFELYVGLYYDPVSASGRDWVLTCSYSEFLEFIDDVVSVMFSHYDSEEEF